MTVVKNSLMLLFLEEIYLDNIDLFFIGRAKQLFDDCINNRTNSQLINRANKTEFGLFTRVCGALNNKNIKERIGQLLQGELQDKTLMFLWYEVDEEHATEIFMDCII